METEMDATINAGSRNDRSVSERNLAAQCKARICVTTLILGYEVVQDFLHPPNSTSDNGICGTTLYAPGSSSGMWRQARAAVVSEGK